MVDAEKVKKGLDTCALRSAGDCTCCPYFENTYCNDLLASDAAEYIESLEERIAIMQESMEAQEKMLKRFQWNDIEKKPPREGREYLITISPPATTVQVMEVYLDALGRWRHGNAMIDEDVITHWMPLPEPPKEVTP